MKSEFSLAFNQICAEYGLPREVVLEAVRAALANAYRRDRKIPATQGVSADISLETGLARIFTERTVVDVVDDPQTQITADDAVQIRPNAEIDDIVLVDVTPSNFGRIAAQTAKQVIMQRLREAERESQFHRFSRQENEIIIGTVQSIAPHGVTLHLERTEEAHMPRREQIPGERYSLHSKIRVYVLEVRRTSRGPEIIVTRSHPKMLRRLLELEVPEIRAGQVEVNAVAREAGARAKVAVSARQPGLDPVGACVGMRGMRIQTISRELHGERIDVVLYDKDAQTFIVNALSVPLIVSVTLDDNNAGARTANVVVMDEHLSLAIGRSGQNARLAAKLTGWRVDIQGATEAAKWALEQVNKTPELLDTLRNDAQLIPRLASIMRMHETDRYPYTDEERSTIGVVVHAVRQALIDRRNAERPGAQQARERRTAQREVEAERVKAKEEARQRVPKQAYEIPLAELDVPTKVHTNLVNNNLENVGQIMERLSIGDEELLVLHGIGIKALRDIKNAVEELELVDADLDEEEEAVAPEPVPLVETVEQVDEKVVELPESETEEEVAAEVEILQETEPETESEVAPETEEVPVFDVENFTEVVEAYDVYEEDEELVPEDGDSLAEPDRKDRKGRRRKQRAVFYDDESGETYIRRRHRSDAWDEYGDNF
ncbi:MAG: transcription termination factor NusA [Anaerolineae bacterium]|nr:transcription termination factor NusA [Anaerolineae bacterium]